MLLQFGRRASVIRATNETSINAPLALVQEQPFISLANPNIYDRSSLFTVVIRDLDATLSPGSGSGVYYHLLAINTNKLLEGGIVVIPYEKPQQVGHRYVYEVYKQIESYTLSGSVGRRTFDLAGTVAGAGLTLVGRITVLTMGDLADRGRFLGASPTRRDDTYRGTSPTRRSVQRSPSPRRDTTTLYNNLPPLAPQPNIFASPTQPLAPQPNIFASPPSSPRGNRRNVAFVPTQPLAAEPTTSFATASRFASPAPIQTQTQNQTVSPRGSRRGVSFVPSQALAPQPAPSVSLPASPSRQIIIPPQILASSPSQTGFVRGLEGSDEKECSCRVKVAAKGTAVNPYAVCKHSTHGHMHTCSEYYDFEAMTPEQLRGYASLEHLDVSNATTKQDLLNAIYAWKRGGGR